MASCEHTTCTQDNDILTEKAVQIHACMWIDRQLDGRTNLRSKSVPAGEVPYELQSSEHQYAAISLHTAHLLT